MEVQGSHLSHHSLPLCDPCVLCIPLMCAGGDCFLCLSEKQQGQEGRNTTETTLLPSGAADRSVSSFPRPLSKELAESLTTAGLAPGLCSGFLKSS